MKRIREEVMSKVSNLNVPTPSTSSCGAKRTSTDAMLYEDGGTTSSEPNTSSSQTVSRRTF